jgi:hypothetical protein
LFNRPRNAFDEVAYRKSSMTTSTSHGRTGLLVVFRVSSVFFFPFIRSSNNP